MTERLNAYAIEDHIPERRDEVISALKFNGDYLQAENKDMIRKMLKGLADELPKDKPLWYASKEMQPYREKINRISERLINLSPRAREADRAFRKELREKESKLKGIMGNYYKERRERELHIVQNMEGFTEIGEGLKTLHTIEALEWDYKRRLGNIVLCKVREIQKETYKRNPRRKYKTNDKELKRKLTVSARKVNRIMDGLFGSVAELFLPETQNYRNRLKEIEEEMQEQYDKEHCPQEQSRSKWEWGK